MTFKTLPITLLLGGIVTAFAASAQWAPVGSTNFAGGGVEYTSLAIAKGDTPVVAFRDNYTPNGGRLTVMQYNQGNNTWFSLGNTGFSAHAVKETSIAVDTVSGQLYVAYLDTSDGLHVDKFDGANTWSAVGTAGFVSNDQVYDIKLMIAGDGTPYVGYIDGNQSYKANMMKYSGGSWQQVGSANFSSTTNTWVDFALDNNGTPYAASEASGFPEEIQVQKFDGTSWVNVGSTSFDTADFSTPVAMAIDRNNQPYVAVTNHDDNQTVRVWHYNGTAWVKVGGVSATGTDQADVKLAISVQNYPILAYTDHSGTTLQASVKAFNGVSWVQVGNANFTAGEADFTALAVNSKNDIFVAYEDFANGKGATVQTYLHNVGIHDVAGLAGFKLYPNPNNGVFQISFKTAQAGSADLMVTDMMGRSVWQKSIAASNGAESVDLSAIAKGIYSLQVKTATGTETRLVEIQ